MRKIATVPAIILVTLTLTLASVGFGVAMQGAQQPQMTPEQYFELLRQDIERDRVALMGGAMGFNSQEAAAFWPIYEEYQAEFKQLSDRKVQVILDYARNYESMSDDKARELANAALSIEEQRVALLRRYFERVDEALGAIIATRFIQVENQLTNLIQVKLASEIPLIRRQ